MALPGFGTQPFGTAHFGIAIWNITVTYGRGRSRSLTTAGASRTLAVTPREQ